MIEWEELDKMKKTKDIKKQQEENDEWDLSVDEWCVRENDTTEKRRRTHWQDWEEEEEKKKKKKITASQEFSLHLG